MSDFDLSAFLAARITDEGLTQAEFARQIGVSQPSLYALLHGGEPRRKTYEALIRRYPQLIALSVFAAGKAAS